MTPRSRALIDELCYSTVTKKTNRVEVDAATVRQVPELDMLKAQIRSRPPIVDAASRVVYEWFINWAAEFNGVSVSVPYGGYKSDYGELPALPEMMRRGRRVGEPMCKGCSIVCEAE